MTEIQTKLHCRICGIRSAGKAFRVEAFNGRYGGSYAKKLDAENRVAELNLKAGGDRLNSPDMWTFKEVDSPYCHEAQCPSFTWDPL